MFTLIRALVGALSGYRQSRKSFCQGLLSEALVRASDQVD